MFNLVGAKVDFDFAYLNFDFKNQEVDISRTRFSPRTHKWGQRKDMVMLMNRTLSARSSDDIRGRI